jgi:sugar phosphate isomerase/epimerase
MIWGYAGVFPGEFRIWDGDPFRNRYRFLATHGFRATGIGLKAALEPEKRAFLRGDEAASAVVHSVHVSLPFFTAPLAELRDGVAEVLEQLAGVKDDIRARLVVVNAGPFHRYMREPSLGFQLGRLAEVLAPLAEGAHRLGVRTGLENHCDYLVEDILGLGARVPHLGLFWDTGNGAMTGDHPALVAGRAAPHAVGCHFKDFFAFPNEKNLMLEMKGASLGDGDMALEAVYRSLSELHPDPGSLLMEFELVPDPSLNPWVSLERSKRFVERLSGWKFHYPEVR